MTRTIASLAVLLACACANRAATPATHASEPEVADGDHLTEFQLARLLGHYSTLDGRSGFILDQTQQPPRARLDGDDTIRELARRGSVYGAYELISDDGAIWLRIHEDSGSVLLFQGPQQTQGVDVVRDADARRLD